MAKKNEFVNEDPFDMIYPGGEVVPQTESEGSPTVPDLSTSLLDEQIVEERAKRANHVDNYMAGLMASIKTTGNPNLEITSEYQRQKFKSKIDPTYETQAEEARQSLTDRQQASITDMIDQGFSMGVTDPDELREGVETQQEIADINNNKSIEELFVDSLSLEPDELRRREQAFQISALKDISDLMEDQSMIDKVTNYAGLFILSDQGIDWSRVVGSGILDSGERAEEFVNKFQSMPADVKARLWPQIKGAIEESTDENNIKSALALMTLLDPTAPEELRTEVAISNSFLGLDVATLGYAIVSRIAKMVKAANLVKSLKIVGATDEAATMSTAAGFDKSGAIAKNMGIDADVPGMNGSPFKVEDMVPEATDGINKEVQNILREVEAGRTTTYSRITDAVENTVKEGILFEREKARVKDRAIQAVEKYRQEVFEQHGWNIDDVKVSDSTESGFKLTYKVEGVPVERKIEYKLNDIGEMEATHGGDLKTGAIEAFLGSPMFKLSDKEVVHSATRVELARAKISETFTKRVQEITTKNLGSPLNPLNRKKYKNVDDVLLAGDDFEQGVGNYGKVYSISELRNGIRVRDDRIVRLSDKEIVSYYQLRDLFDNAWVMKNQATRKALVANGVKEVNFEGIKTMAKDFASATTARKSFDDNGVHSIFDPTINSGKGGTRRISDIDLDDLYNRGYKVVRFHKGSQEFGQKMAGNEHATHAIVHNTKIGNLPTTVIHYKKGYVPRIDKHGYYFVKEPIKGTLDGVAGKTIGSRTLRIFDNKKEADAYAKALTRDDPGKEYKVLHDRQMAETDLADEALGISGGLYTSPRASHPILFGAEGTTRPRMSAMESLQRNLQHLSNLIPRNEWRIGMQQRWLNTARNMHARTGTGIRQNEGFHAHISGENHTKQWRALSESRKYIEDQLRIPTASEKAYSDMMRGFVEWAEGAPLLGTKKLQGLRNSVMDAGSIDPFGAMRAGTFHALLGWFNPAQVLVQAQGASVAFSMYPEHAFNASRAGMVLRSMMFTVPQGASQEVVRGRAVIAAKASGMSVDDVVENFNLWRRSGLQESIRSTADHASTAQGYGHTLNALKNIADKGLMFYREGEFVTRGYGLMTAKEVWKKANPGKVIDDAAEKEILSSAMSIQLNLTRANRAAWQRGALSIPTQFLQIMTKYGEKILGKDFDGKRNQLMMMQFGLYGGAGALGGEALINNVAEMMGVTPEEMTPEQKAFARGGVMDAMMMAAFGADVEIGKRGAIISGVEDLMEDVLYGDSSVGEMAIGAFGSTATRAADAWTSVKPLIIASHLGDRDLTMDDYTFMASEFASILSTWRNIDKAMLMHRSGLATTSSGNITIDNSLTGFNGAEVLIQAVGFTPAEPANVYDMQKWLREEKEHIKTRISSVIDIHYRYASRDKNDVDRARSTELMVSYLLRDLSPHQRQAVIDGVRKKITQGEDTRARVIRQYYRDAAVDITNSFQAAPVTNTVIPTVEEE